MCASVSSLCRSSTSASCTSCLQQGKRYIAYAHMRSSKARLGRIGCFSNILTRKAPFEYLASLVRRPDGKRACHGAVAAVRRHVKDERLGGLLFV
jgi:hypothetical protein